MNANSMNKYTDKPSLEGETDAQSGLALLSHDLRSSLAGILGSLTIIDDTKVDQDTKDHLNRARASGQMLQELLDLAFDMGDDKTLLENNGDPVCVKDELAVISDIWKVPANTSAGVFSVNLPENSPLLESSDRVSFHRILNNLIGNAHKFSTDGDVSVNVITQDNATITIEVTDSGPGFSDEAMARVFQFRSRPENSDKPGSGLGLYIASTLTKGMGGTIAAHNRATGGARMTVTLPICQKAKAIVQNAVDDTLPDLSHLNILLAEDNITNQLVVTQMLKTMGAKYEVASDGVEAIALFEKGNFDLGLLDIEMPRKSGLEVLREIRASGGNKSRIPLVALTAYVMPEHRERIENAGADGIIGKPIEGIAALGRFILKYMHTTAPTKELPVQNQNISSDNSDDIGRVERDIFDALITAIGPDTKGELLEKVMIDLQNMQTALIEAEAANALPAIQSASHTLVSVAGAIGAVNLQKCAESLNAETRDENGLNRQSLNMDCIKGISEVLTFLAKQ